MENRSSQHLVSMIVRMRNNQKALNSNTTDDYIRYTDTLSRPCTVISSCVARQTSEPNLLRRREHGEQQSIFRQQQRN